VSNFVVPCRNLISCRWKCWRWCW